MRLLKIGRDASCNIVLHSDKVSSLHAEMTILNNGDILLEDKNSRNGTFLMNKPIFSAISIVIIVLLFGELLKQQCEQVWVHLLVILMVALKNFGHSLSDLQVEQLQVCFPAHFSSKQMSLG